MNHIPNTQSLSFMKAKWALPDTQLDQVEQLARRHDIPEIVARLLLHRGIPEDEVDAFLNPTLKDHFPDPFSLIDMEEMAEYVAVAIDQKKQIAIFGDFDVDGATSSAVLYRFLKACGIEARIYIPERLTEGYGPNCEAMQTLREEGIELLFILDCGTTAFEPLATAKEIGLEVIVVDHHEAEDTLPEAKFVINPKRKDDTSGLDMLAAVGMTFMVCVAINNKLRESGFYKNNGIPEAPLKDHLDLVALGTVCDMVPIIEINRLLVRHGFLRMNRTQNTGLQALIQVSGVTGALNPYHAGFVLGPRINAGSRVHKSDLGAQLLSIDDPEEVKNIAWTLNDCNDKRKAMQSQMEQEAIEMAEAMGADAHSVIIVGKEGWHSGLSGLVAGRLKDKYAKPACVVTFVENEKGVLEGRGSGRSIPGVHIAQAFIDARQEGLIEKGGGHAMAGGFTVLPDKMEAFRAFMAEHVSRQAANLEANVTTDIDAIMTVRGTKTEFIKVIHEKMGPFGQGYSEPLFMFQNVRIHSADIVGDSHIRLLVSDWEGGPRIKAMAFRAVGTDLGDALLKEGRRAFDLCGNIKVNEWNGRENAEMHLKDARFNDAQSDAQSDGQADQGAQEQMAI